MTMSALPELGGRLGLVAHLEAGTELGGSFPDKDKVRRERTDWHSLVLWGKRAEALAKILAKGTSIFVEGRLGTSSYEDRDGNKRTKTEVTVTNVILVSRGRPADPEARECGNGRSAGQAQGARPEARPPPEVEPDGHDQEGYGDDDIPF